MSNTLNMYNGTPFIHPFWIGSTGSLHLSPQTRLHTPLSSLVQPTFIIHLQRTDLKHSRASCNSVVSDGGVATGQDDVCLARDGRGAVRCRWDCDGETSGDGRCTAERISHASQILDKTAWKGGKDLRSKDRAGDGDESGVDLRFSISGRDNGAGCQEGD